jgi:hypothetical protein
MILREQRAPGAHAAFPRCVVSESEERAEGDAQVIVRALVEINLVSRFEPETYGAQRGLDSRTRVKRSVQVRSTKIKERANDINIRQQAGTEPEIHEPSFKRGKRMEMTSASHERWAKESVSYADRCVLNGDDVASNDVGVGFVEVESVVVGQFALEHDIPMHTKTQADSQPEVIGAGLGDVERVEEYPGFDALLGKCECRKEKAGGQNQGELAHGSAGTMKPAAVRLLPGQRFTRGLLGRASTAAAAEVAAESKCLPEFP